MSPHGGGLRPPPTTILTFYRTKYAFIETFRGIPCSIDVSSEARKIDELKGRLKMNDAEKLPKNKFHEVTKYSLLNIQVCSSGTEDEALDWLRSACPAGTSMNWQRQEEPNLKPIACANGNGRMHYVYVC